MRSKVGDKVYIRAIPFHYTGQIDEITDVSIVLSEAAWIADSGRFFSVALKSGVWGEGAEIEPYPHGTEVMKEAIVDIAPWPHNLPRSRIPA